MGGIFFLRVRNFMQSEIHALQTLNLLFITTMPRLRKISKKKYGYVESSSDEDDEIIINNTSNEKLSKNIFRIYLIVLVILNSAFISLPYYRKGINALFSACACITLFAPVVFTYNMVCIAKLHIPFIENIKFLMIVTISYHIILAIKMIKFWVSLKDWLYLLPLFILMFILNLGRK